MVQYVASSAEETCMKCQCRRKTAAAVVVVVVVIVVEQWRNGSHLT